MKKHLTEIAFTLISAFLLLGLIFSEQLGCMVFTREEAAPVEVPELKFGLPVDSFRILEGEVLPGQNLGDILTAYGVTLMKVDQLARVSTGIFDVRKIRTGQRFFLFQSPDTTREAKHLVYLRDPVNYVVFNLADSLSISLGKRDIRLVHKTASGIIRSNLWNTMTENRLNPMLALQLEDVYQWTIDLFGLQKGDRFRVLYEEQFVDSVSIGIGPIQASQFEHVGRNYQAYRFFQDTVFDYFDEKGENLRKAFLKAPLKFSRISSRFSGSRFHPVLKIRRPHHGVDYAAPSGTPVFSIGEGTVVEKGFQGGGAGNYLKIRHNATYTTTYMHLRGFASGISVGVRVRQGQEIGYVGSTGLSTGAHLDFRVHRNGMPVDPLKIEAPPGKPVRDDLKQAYWAVKDSLSGRLDSVKWLN